MERNLSLEFENKLLRDQLNLAASAIESKNYELVTLTRKYNKLLTESLTYDYTRAETYSR